MLQIYFVLHSQQYGIITNLGVATNGEISDCVAKVGLSNSSKVVSETSHAFKVSEDCREGKHLHCIKILYMITFCLKMFIILTIIFCMLTFP